jgi:hypothetical protein
MSAQSEAVYEKFGDLAVFNQLGVKLLFADETSDAEYYGWLDSMKADIGGLVPGAEIAEKSYARTEPRMNTGVYYDTADYRLLGRRMVLRTTCNIKTHAFCAFKLAEDEQQTRKDHRYVFQGEEKRTIQTDPVSPEAVAIVKRLLNRQDIDQPGRRLLAATGIAGAELFPAIVLKQYRHPFFVWLDKRDALRCSMDRVTVQDLRLPEGERPSRTFSEIELPIYPHVDNDMVEDPRLLQLIHTLSGSLQERFGIDLTTDSKYERAAAALGIRGAPREGPVSSALS